MQLSILLPTHNRADVLPFAIESVLTQTFTDFELLVVGDGCTDGTAEVVERYVAQDHRVRWFDLPKGFSFGYENRNIALREARGELIAFMAHDDVNAPDHYRGLVSLMDDSKIQFGYSSAVWIAKNGDMVPTIFHLEDSEMRKGFLDKVWNRLPANCFIHRAEAFEKVGMWNGELKKGGDIDFWGRIVQHYGHQAVKGLPVFSTFHFRAIWRTQEFINPDNEPPWLRLHTQTERLSPWLKLDVPVGQTEQEALSSWFRIKPEAAHEINHACLHALMSHDWDLEKLADGQLTELQNLKQQLSELDVLSERTGNLVQQRDALKLERDRLKAKIKEQKATKEAQNKRRWWHWFG